MNSNNVQRFHAVLVSLRFQNLYKLLTELAMLYLIAMVHGKHVIHRAQLQYGFQGFLWTMEEEEEEPQEEPAEELEEVMLLDSEERR